MLDNSYAKDRTAVLSFEIVKGATVTIYASAPERDLYE